MGRIKYTYGANQWDLTMRSCVGSQHLAFPSQITLATLLKIQCTGPTYDFWSPSVWYIFITWCVIFIMDYGFSFTLQILVLSCKKCTLHTMPDDSL